MYPSRDPYLGSELIDAGARRPAAVAEHVPHKEVEALLLLPRCHACVHIECERIRDRVAARACARHASQHIDDAKRLRTVDVWILQSSAYVPTTSSGVSAGQVVTSVV